MQTQGTWLSISREQVEQFHKNGFVVIRNFASHELCSSLRDAILSYAAEGPITRVEWPRSRFNTFNGERVDDSIPALKDLYDGHLLKEMSRLAGTSLETVSDRRVGLSINLTAQGDKFEHHYDRHHFTAVLYVNSDYVGGEMTFFPRVRYWLGHPRGALHRRAQRVLDRLVRRPTYLRWFGKRVILKPRAGDLLIFEGTRTYHAVMPMVNGNTRLSIQFAYDRPGMVFDVSGYYGQ